VPGNTAPSERAAKISCAEEGFLLVFLIPLLLLFLLFLAGSLKVAWRTQEKMALQSRLDVCALRMALERKSTLNSLVNWNLGIQATAWGIYAARGVKVLGPVGAAVGGASEIVLLRTNAALAAAQEAQLRAAGMKELYRLRCEGGTFSSEPAFCTPSPSLHKALKRQSALFPDVKGTLSHESRNGSLATFRCRSGGSDKATVELSGDGRLLKKGFRDAWQE
jgi:hypothetical protein